MTRETTTRWETGEYGRSEEIANAMTHGLGALLSLSGLIFLIILSAQQPDPVRIISAVIFGSSLSLLFLISTLYHCPQPPHLKRLFQVLDHCAIYLLIAGTYTPFLLISMKGAWGYTLMAIVWGLALSGIIFKAIFKDRYEKLSLFTYLAMGWLAIVAISEVIAKIPSDALILVSIGGVVYTAGTIFYALDRIPYNHAIWHLFVLGGSALHFFAVYQIVIPQTI
jgi:hemolysin III